MPPFRAVCFDLDGVLIDTMPLHAQAWQEALRPLGLRVSKRAIYEWEGESGVVTAATLLSRTGKPPSRRAIASLLDAKERRFQRLARRVRVHPRLAALLAELSAQKLPMALVTGTSAREVRRVVPSRLRARFTAVVTGDQMRRGKPHPEPYRTVLRKLQVPPHRAVVVENAPYGIRSARGAKAGMVVALASSLPPRFLREADIIVSSVPQLCACLKQLLTP